MTGRSKQFWGSFVVVDSLLVYTPHIIIPKEGVIEVEVSFVTVKKEDLKKPRLLTVFSFYFLNGTPRKFRVMSIFLTFY